MEYLVVEAPRCGNPEALPARGNFPNSGMTMPVPMRENETTSSPTIPARLQDSHRVCNPHLSTMFSIIAVAMPLCINPRIAASRDKSPADINMSVYKWNCLVSELDTHRPRFPEQSLLPRLERQACAKVS